MNQRNVILDTDIGFDIDDTWALGMLLNMPELKTKLVLAVSQTPEYTGAVAAKFLQEVGRSDIPVAINPANRKADAPPQPLRNWLGCFKLEDYSGTVLRNGIEEMIRLIEIHKETTIIGIGPMTNLAEFCRRRPDLVSKCRLIAMAGSFHKNFRDAPGKIAEYNVEHDIPASQTVFSADWKEFIITPLDHCGNMIVGGGLYQQFKESQQAIPRTIQESYRSWLLLSGAPDDAETASSILYDTVAVYLAATERNVKFADMNLIVDDKGFLQTAPGGRPVRVAMEWEDIDAFKHELIGILLRGTVKQ